MSMFEEIEKCLECDGKGRITITIDITSEYFDASHAYAFITPSENRTNYIKTAAYYLKEKNQEWDEGTCWLKATEEIDQKYRFMKKKCHKCSGKGTLTKYSSNMRVGQMIFPRIRPPNYY